MSWRNEMAGGASPLRIAANRRNALKSTVTSSRFFRPKDPGAAKKKFRAKLKEITDWLKRERNRIVHKLDPFRRTVGSHGY